MWTVQTTEPASGFKKIPLLPNTDYLFSGWVRTLGDINLPTLRVTLGTNAVGSAFVASISSEWQRFAVGFNSGANPAAMVGLRDGNTIAHLNDFCIDDLVLVPAFATISGTIVLQSSANLAQQITFTFQPSAGSPFNRTILLNANGGYRLTGIPVDKYAVSIKGAKWLRKNIIVDARLGNVANANATLLAGDGNDDNFADIADLSLLIASYNKVSSNAGYSEAADFNCDGVNDISDLLLLVANYNKQGDS